MNDRTLITDQDRFIPEPDELATELVALAVSGDLDPLSRRVNLKKEELELMLASDEATGDLLAAIAAEYEEMVRMKLLLRSGEAVETLTGAMRGRFDGKLAMAAVKAASEVLDRSRFPKQTRVQHTDRDGPKRKTLPSLEDLLEKVDNPDQAQEILKRHMAVMDEIEALRKGAKEIIDVRPEIQTQPES